MRKTFPMIASLGFVGMPVSQSDFQTEHPQRPNQPAKNDQPAKPALNGSDETPERPPH
jgi:hypothetical protein